MQANPPRPWFFSLSLAWKFALVLLVVLALLVSFSPQVVNALRGLFGYIPNVGVVDQSVAVLILDEPVQATLGDIPLTVERAFATRVKTVVVYQYKVQPWDGKKYQQAESPDRPALLLPDGRRLEVVTGLRQSADNGAIRYALEFGPLPLNVTTATLQLDRLAGMPPELSPKDGRSRCASSPATHPRSSSRSPYMNPPPLRHQRLLRRLPNLRHPPTQLAPLLNPAQQTPRLPLSLPPAQPLPLAR